MPPPSTQRRMDEELRRVKWPILSAISGKGRPEPVRNNAVLVTSALPSEGKSFIALNLALNIARDKETRVILVDGDVARPALTPAFGLDDAKGLNDVLSGSVAEFEDVLYSTNVEGLMFMPAGQWDDQSPEFFAGSRMSDIVQKLCRFVGGGVVLVDSPPLLATNEAQVASRYVGQVLMVVRADHTEQRAVLDAQALIDSGTTVQAVLNCVEPSLMSRYYGNHYYEYGKYYDAERAAKSGKNPRDS